jgi:hypothetical protein
MAWFLMKHKDNLTLTCTVDDMYPLKVQPVNSKFIIIVLHCLEVKLCQKRRIQNKGHSTHWLPQESMNRNGKPKQAEPSPWKKKKMGIQFFIYLRAGLNSEWPITE